MDTKSLITIGEMSKITGASIYSIRYYERIGLLSPEFIDSGTGYRYYSLEQSYLIGMIKMCAELDIPLKELSRFIDKDSHIDILSLLAHFKKSARERLRKLEHVLDFVEKLENKIALTEEFSEKQIYERILPEKKYYYMPYEKPFDSMSINDWIDLFSIDSFKSEYGDYENPECVLMCLHSKGVIKRYAAVEVPEAKVEDISSEHVLTMPGGTYICKQDKDDQIEKAPQIFDEYLKGAESFIVIESALISGKNKVNEVVNEVRVKVLC